MKRGLGEIAQPDTARKRLSGAHFGQMCREAARQSTDCREYVCGVMTKLCQWLGIPDRAETFRWECETEGGNVQRVILSLYQLLEEKCLCDFDPQAILNSHSAGEQ